jgi:hypothetical protein
MSNEIVAAIIAGIFALIVGIIGVGGIIIGVIGSLFISARTARIEEQRHLRELDFRDKQQRQELELRDRQQFRELGIRVGLANFEQCMALAKSAANRFHEPFRVPPLTGFIIQGIKQMEIVSDPHLSAEEMARKIAECEDFAQTFILAARKKADNASQSQP